MPPPALAPVPVSNLFCRRRFVHVQESKRLSHPRPLSPSLVFLLKTFAWVLVVLSCFVLFWSGPRGVTVVQCRGEYCSFRLASTATPCLCYLWRRRWRRGTAVDKHRFSQYSSAAIARYLESASVSCTWNLHRLDQNSCMYVRRSTRRNPCNVAG